MYNLNFKGLYLEIAQQNPDMTRWPSGLRRNVKAVVFIGGGSNPPRVMILFVQVYHTSPKVIICRVRAGRKKVLVYGIYVDVLYLEDYVFVDALLVHVI